jgi:hypothetical protein
MGSEAVLVGAKSPRNNSKTLRRVSNHQPLQNEGEYCFQIIDLLFNLPIIAGLLYKGAPEIQMSLLRGCVFVPSGMERFAKGI